MMELDNFWIKEDIEAYLISKQRNIGNIHPIIVQSVGTDFSALLYINLNNNGDFISGTFLYGGEDDGSGVKLETDSLILLQPITKCHFDKNFIYTYSNSVSIQKFNSTDIIDSVTYRTSIEMDGTIKRTRLDSTRIYRKFQDRIIYNH